MDEYAEIVGSICDSVNENLQNDNLIDAGENTVRPPCSFFVITIIITWRDRSFGIVNLG